MSGEVGGFNVSRETMVDLTHYHDLLLKWTPKINLISKSSVPFVWDRHIWDSWQLVEYSGNVRSWVDFGSGAGFPGLVIAIFSKHSDPHRRTTLVESDQRKSAFLRVVIRELSLNATIETQRVEHLEHQNADIVSARALAHLSQLLEFTERHLAPNGAAYFLKGASWEKEVQTARDTWSFSLQAHTSKTNPEAAVLEIKDIQRV